jgi:hypothetical protein
MSLVEAILRDSLKRVITSNTDGNALNSSGFNEYIATRRMIRAKVILVANSISRIIDGSGTIIIVSVTTSPRGSK